MTAIILAAGKGERLKPLTDKIPKPLVKVNNVSLIRRILNNLPSAIDKIIIVIGYKGDLIVKEIGTKVKDKQIQYVWQLNDCCGTWCAVYSAKKFIDKDFLVICSDNIYRKRDLRKLASQNNSYLAMRLGKKSKRMIYPFAKYSIFDVPRQNEVLLDLGAWHIADRSIILRNQNESNNGEISLPNAIKEYCNSMKVSFKPIFVTFWIPVGNVEELKMAKKLLQRN